MAHGGKNSVNVDLNFQIQNLREINAQVSSFLGKLTDGSKTKIDLSKSFSSVQAALSNLEKMSKRAFSNDFDFEKTQEAIRTVKNLYDQLFSELSKSAPDIELIDDDVFAAARKKIEELNASIVKARHDALLTLKNDKSIISLNLDESSFEGDFDSLVELARKKGAEASKAYDDAFAAEQKAEKDLTDFKSKKGGYEDQVELSKRIGVFKKGLTSSRSAFYGKSSELFGQAREGRFTGNVGAFREELQKSLEGTYKSLNAGDLKEAIKLAITNDKFKGVQSGEYSIEDLAKDLLEILNTSSTYTISQKTIDDLHDKTIALSEAKKTTKEKERTRDKTQRAITNLEGRRAELVDAPAAGANAQIEEQNRLILEHAAAQREAAYEAENFGKKQSEMSGDLNDANNKLEESRKQLKEISGLSSATQTITNFINRYVGLAAIIRTTISMFKSAISTIREIDKTITDIAVVTNMSQDTLWGKIGEYTNLANSYGVAVNDVYTVSKIFYQQGLQTADVMSMTTETLKMAKIAGMSYTEAADAMTVATRAFNIEIGKASIVSDVYSKLAASMAVDSQEIAYAMEKTASSAANVGMSLETTSAFISTMVQATREGAQNIGSAIKSIISRLK